MPATQPVSAMRDALAPAALAPALQPPRAAPPHGRLAVGRQACARGAFHAEGTEERLGAMMTAPQRHAVAIEVTADILGGEALDAEGDHAPPIVGIGRPQHPHARNRA